MPVLKYVDISIKKIYSVLFRIILVIYSILILVRNENIFPTYYYVFGIILYIIIFKLLYFKKGIFSYLRLLNDYLFFVLILWDKPINDFFNLCLLFLPLIFSTNHSTSEKRASFSIGLFIITVITLFVLNGFAFEWTYLIAVFVIMLINLLTYLRTYVLRIYNDLHDSIDVFYQNDFNIFSNNKILNSILTKIKNDKKVLKFFLVPDNILVFKIKNEELRLANSAKFISTFKIEDEKTLISNIKESKIITNTAIIIDDKKYEKTISTLIENGKTSYVFLITAETKIFCILYIAKLLDPLFSKVIKVLEVEERLHDEKNRYLDNIKSKTQFVLSTIQAVHFLNNALTPITSYFSLTKRYDELTDEGMRNDILKLIESERVRARASLSSILERFDLIMERSLNPYIVQGMFVFSLFKIFANVRKVWDYNDMNKDWFLSKWDKEILSKTLSTNIDSFEYIIEEILLNIKAHSTGEYQVLFDYEDLPLIIFKNRIKSFDKNKTNLLRIIKNFNNDDSSEMDKRKSYGLTFIKQFLVQLNMNYEAKLESDFFILVLKFNLIKNEDSNIREPMVQS